MSKMCACGQREITESAGDLNGHGQGRATGGCGCGGGRGHGGHGHGHGGGGCGCGGGGRRKAVNPNIVDRSEGRHQLGLRSAL